MSATSVPVPRFSRWCGATLIGLSVLLGLLALFGFSGRPDWLAAQTVIPALLWWGIGILLLLPAIWFNRRRQLGLGRWFLPPVCVWLVFLVLFVEEFRSLTRTLWVETPKTFDTQRAQSKAIRVVSLNCAGGTRGVAAEVEQFNPDVVLLQEIPRAEEVQALALRLFGPSAGLHLKLDTAVLTRWPARPLEQDRLSEKFVAGVVTTLPDGRELLAVSLHLMVPPLDFALWSPATWRAYADARAVQRLQLGLILKMIDKPPSQALVIVGGDFNAPQGDGALQRLKPRLRDAFDRAGVGWGNTIINDLPLLRIDQIWSSQTLLPVTVRAFKSDNSDHRLVVAEFLLAE